MRRRTRARELALQFLYTVEMKGADARDELDDFLVAAGASRVARAFATQLIDGVLAQQVAIDKVLAATATNWSLSRMPPVDRNILRLGAFELLHSTDVPVEVALNEAIELGKRYSTANSGSFINGILDKVKSRRTLPVAVKNPPDASDEDEPLPPDHEDAR
ncbi:MAG: transcription antitermination factor NusB [Planctomycetes bacterium]|nr:transcription antitermination factor NusB [Planctomycetota bacterium]